MSNLFLMATHGPGQASRATINGGTNKVPCEKKNGSQVSKDKIEIRILFSENIEELCVILLLSTGCDSASDWSKKIMPCCVQVYTRWPLDFVGKHVMPDDIFLS